MRDSLSASSRSMKKWLAQCENIADIPGLAKGKEREWGTWRKRERA